MNDQAPLQGKHRFRPGAGTFLTLGIIALFFYILWPHFGPLGEAPFDRETWLAHAGDMRPKNPRRAMRKDLLENRLKPGMTIKAVWALLGRPDFPGGCQAMTDEEILNNPGCFSYTFGWSMMDPESLNVVFDSDGRLESVQVVNH